jgi:hypothetical protein
LPTAADQNPVFQAIYCTSRLSQVGATLRFGCPISRYWGFEIANRIVCSVDDCLHIRSSNNAIFILTINDVATGEQLCHLHTQSVEFFAFFQDYNNESNIDQCSNY